MRAVSLIFPAVLMGCQANIEPIEQLPPPVQETVTVIEEPVVEEVVKRPPAPRFIIENIMNLTPDTLQNILGLPSLKRVEGDVRVWLYRNSQCVLHLYFYPDDNGDSRLDYVATEAVNPLADNPTVSPNACLDSHVIPTEGPQPSYPDTNTDLQPDRSDN